MGGVANVCRPTIWAGPSPSRKSLNWLSGPRRVVGKTNLQLRGNWGKLCSNIADKRAEEWRLTFRQSCLSWCCHQWSPCCPAASLGSSSPQRCQSRCSAGWYSEASWSRPLQSTGCSSFYLCWSKLIHGEKKEGSVEETDSDGTMAVNRGSRGSPRTHKGDPLFLYVDELAAYPGCTHLSPNGSCILTAY